MPKRVLIVEDDPQRASEVEAAFRSNGIAVLFSVVSNEKEFIQRFEEWADAPPALAVIDLLIPYTTEEDGADDEKALKLNAFMGGLRCYELLQHNARTQRIPVIFYTILDQERVPEGTMYVKKTGDFSAPELISKVRQILLASS